MSYVVEICKKYESVYKIKTQILYIKDKSLLQLIRVNVIIKLSVVFVIDLFP